MTPRCLTVFAACCLVAACGMTEPQDTRYVIRVDSARLQGPVSPGDTAMVRIWGFVGPSGLYYFDEAEVERTDSTATVTMYGRLHSSEEGGGTDAFIHLDEIVEVGPVEQLPFAIGVVRNEGGSTIDIDIR